MGDEMKYICYICKKPTWSPDELCQKCSVKSPHTERLYVSGKRAPRERMHKLRGLTHRGDKSDCIICNQRAPGISGYMGGGVRGVK